MPTLFERLQEYKKLPGAITFSNKKIRALAFILKRIYDNHKFNPPIEYVESMEEDKVFRVRNYPASFVKTIDGMIDKFHITLVKNINREQALPSKVITEKPPASETTKKAEKRKRIPMKKPVYSTKK